MAKAAEQIRIGGYVIALFKGLDAWDTDTPAFDEFEATLVAGKASDFLSSIRALPNVNAEEFEIRRKLARLRRRDVPEILRILERANLINVVQNDTLTPGLVREVVPVVTDRTGVLAASAVLFEELGPTSLERISIEILDLTSRNPTSEDRLIQEITNLGFDEADIRRCIERLTSLQLITKSLETDRAVPLVYNPQVFTDNSVDAYKLIATLPAPQQEAAMSVIEHVQRNPGVPIPGNFDKSIVLLLAKSGIIDLSGIRARGGSTQKEFPTSPQIWGRFTKTGLSEDLIDDSKLLLNSFRYGEFFSSPSRGQIQDPLVLVSRLIERGQVGAASAIGEDYPMALARGIVGIAESRINPGRYFMELRKRDVAEAVRDVLDQGAIVSIGDDDTHALPAGTEFSSPEKLRIHKKLPKQLVEVRDQLAFELRTHRRRD